MSSRSRSMYPGSSGYLNKRSNNFSLGNGNGKWQGLASTTNKRSALIPAIQKGAGGENRRKVFCFNQLGGIGKKSNMFAPNADGVKLLCTGSEEITSSLPEAEAEADSGSGLGSGLGSSSGSSSGDYSSIYSDWADYYYTGTNNSNIESNIVEMKSPTNSDGITYTVDLSGDVKGLMVNDENNTGNQIGPTSESMGYGLMLAAIYNDKDSFTQLSNTIQAGIWIGSKASDLAIDDVAVNGFEESGLFTWVWGLELENNETTLTANPSKFGSWDSAADGDINIALGYIYGYIAFGASTTMYTFTGDDTTASADTTTLETLMKAYIASIRTNLLYYYDSDASGDSGVLLQDGYQQNNANNDGYDGEATKWHVDYSDLRAFELFSYYDGNENLWYNVYKSTITMFASLLDMDDGRTLITEGDSGYDSSDNTGTFNPYEFYSAGLNHALSYPKRLGNAEHNIPFITTDYTTVYKNVMDYGGDVKRESVKADTDNTGAGYYTDCQRMPIRLSYYLSGSRTSDIFETTITTISNNFQRYLADAFASGYNVASWDDGSGSTRAGGLKPTALIWKGEAADGTTYDASGTIDLDSSTNQYTFKYGSFTPFPTQGEYTQNYTTAGLFALSPNSDTGNVNFYNYLEGRWTDVDLLNPQDNPYNFALSLWGVSNVVSGTNKTSVIEAINAITAAW